MNLTIGVVDCLHPKLGLKALLKSQAELGFPPAKIFTYGQLDAPSSVEVVQIYPLNSGEAVSAWMLHQYSRYIETDHLLNIQADGFVLDGGAWTDEFLEYDYIGAPWGLHPRHAWPPFPNVTTTNRVGNGGFSLRSKKLMVAVSELFDDWSKGEGSHDSKQYHPEDCWICRTNGTRLRELGFKFAPYEVATRFSIENAPITDQLGFHGAMTMRINPKKTRL